jgi:hypothetical protein
MTTPKKSTPKKSTPKKSTPKKATPKQATPKETTRSDDVDPVVSSVLSRVRLRAAIRARWLRSVWPDEQGPASAWSISHDEVDMYLDNRDDPDAEEVWVRDQIGDEQLRLLARVESEIDMDRSSRLAHLCDVFDLAVAERDLVQTCLAAAVDPSLLRVYAYLQDDASRQYVSDTLVARLFRHGRGLLLDTDSALFRWAIVVTTDAGASAPPARTLDPAVCDWLLGGDTLDPDLADVAAMQPVLPALGEWPVDQTVDALGRWLKGERPTPVRVRLLGAQGSGRRSFAALVADRMGLPLLTVTTSVQDPEQWARIYLKAQRQAFLWRCALAFHVDPALWDARVPARVTPFPLQFMVGESAASRSAPAPGVEYLVDLAPTSLETRRELWRAYAPWSADWPQQELETLITQHRTPPADFALIGRHGPTSPAETGAILRDASRDSFGDLAGRLECPFGPDDLVVSDPVQEALDDLLFEARDRAALWELPSARRLFPQGRGLLALFCGPPGTGKTMSAQVIAATLGMDLFRIDLATVVSKWVGETTRNVDRLLRQAAARDVVLLFDEADALFGRRTEIKEANDRFANTDTGYLLQAIEAYEGIALLSTNRRGDIDPAFLRRIRYVLEYELPHEAERLSLWRKLVGELAGQDEAEELDPGLIQLSATVEVAGAQIKSAILTAVFAARRDACPVGLSHLVRGLERELTKEGRPLGERMRTRLVRDAG